jgi:hypothetical protein
MRKIHEFRCGARQQLHALKLRFVELRNAALINA